MDRPDNRRARPALVAVLLVCSLVGAVWGAPGADSAATSAAPGRLGYSALDLPARAVPTPRATAPGPVAPLTPATTPTGRLYRRCVIDYRHIDWTAEPDRIVDDHVAASTSPCATKDWYRDTAFQNGILTFMVLVGEAELAAAAPRSAAAADMADGLRAQGFDRLAATEIVSSGPCEQGEIQAAFFTMRDGHQPDGLEALLASARAAGALVDLRGSVTVITGGGMACAAAIVTADGVVGWVTAANGERLTEALATFRLH